MTDPRLIRLSQVAEQEPSFLWQDRIVRRGLNVLEGYPGCGKSAITYGIAGRVTTGRAMPFCDAGSDPAGVVLFQAEDSLANDVRPNLRAAGADLNRVLAFDRSAAAHQPLTLPDDICAVDAAVTEVDAKLAVFDTFSSFLSVSMNHDQSVRRALGPLAELADRRNIAILLVRHLTKAGRGNPLCRGAGSIGIIGAARSGLVVGDDPACKDKFRHILAHFKGNRASAGSLEYRTVLNRDNTITVEWLGPSNCTADEIITGMQKHERSALHEAVEVLQEILSEGLLPAKEVIKLAADAGVAKRTLYRAKAQLDVTSRKIGGGPSAEWVWELPDGLDRLMDTLIHGPITPITPRPLRRDIIRNSRRGLSQ